MRLSISKLGGIGLAAVLTMLVVCGTVATYRAHTMVGRTVITAFFETSNGIYPGDEVRILGVRVGRINSIEAQPQRIKITFWVDDRYKIPANAEAAILSPSLVTARAIQLTPAYTQGPMMATGAVIPIERTVVPVEWDDFRVQLEKLSDSLQPALPGGVSAVGELVNTAADNLRGQGGTIRDSMVNLSQALSALGDHSQDIFGTVKNLAVLVSALENSGDVLGALNENLSAVTAQLANNPNEVGQAVSDLNAAVTEVKAFVAENKDSLGTTSDKLAEVTQTLGDSSEDLKQALHVFPTTLQNYSNIYSPAQGAVTGALGATNFSNPINFICGAIQAASRLSAAQSAKLCVQYLAPIVKNRQYNFLAPLGLNLFAGATARPNEVTYSEDWMRPDYVSPAAPETVSSNPTPLAAEAPDSASPTVIPTDPSTGLPGLMLQPGGGS